MSNNINLNIKGSDRFKVVMNGVNHEGNNLNINLCIEEVNVQSQSAQSNSNNASILETELHRLNSSDNNQPREDEFGRTFNSESGSSHPSSISANPLISDNMRYWGFLDTLRPESKYQSGSRFTSRTGQRGVTTLSSNPPFFQTSTQQPPRTSANDLLMSMMTTLLTPQPQRQELKSLPQSGDPNRVARNYKRMFESDSKFNSLRTGENGAKIDQYIDLCNAFDTWVLNAMKSSDSGVSSLAISIDKKFGLYLLKFVKTLSDLESAEFLSLLQAPLSNETEQQAVDRMMLKEILYQMSIGQLSDILKVMDTPNCDCEICRL